MSLQPTLPAPTSRYSDIELAYLAEEPPGLWPPNQDSNFGAHRKIFCDVLTDAATQLDLLLNEKFIETSTEFISAHEEELGLTLNQANLNLAQRRAALLARRKRGPFTNSLRIQVIESFISGSLSGGLPPAFGTAGIPLTVSGVPLYSGLTGAPSDYYSVVEDVETFSYAVIIDSRISPDMPGLTRELTRITPAGISFSITGGGGGGGGGGTTIINKTSGGKVGSKAGGTKRITFNKTAGAKSSGVAGSSKTYYGITYNRQGGSTGSVDGATNFTHVDYVILSPFKLHDGGTLRSTLLAANPNIKILTYKAMADMLGTGTDSTNFRRDNATGVSITEATAHDNANPSDLWILRDSSNNILVGAGFGNYVGDIGKQSFRDRWFSNVLDTLQAYGASGVFIDNMIGDYTGISNGVRSPLYPTAASWYAVMKAFSADVCVRLKNAGYYVLPNALNSIAGSPGSDTGQDTINMWNDVGQYWSGAMNENWLDSSSGAHLRQDVSAWTDFYRTWQSLVATAQAKGIDFHGLTVHGTAATAIEMDKYGRAGMLLDWDGVSKSSYCGGYTSGQDPYNINYIFDIGTPLSAKSEIQTAVFRRYYSKGLVILNANASSSYSLAASPDGRTYTYPDGTAVSYPVSIPSGRAVLLTTTSTGGGGGGLAKSSTVSDNFDDNVISSSWTVTAPTGVTVAETGQKLQITPSANAGVYGSVTQVAATDLTSSAVFAQINPGSLTNSNQEVDFGVRKGTNNQYYFNWVYSVSASQIVLRCYKQVAGTVTQLSSVNYSATNHAWVRIRESGGTVFFETSPDGQTWTQQASQATSTAFVPDSIVVGFDAGQDSTASVPTFTATMDNFNVLPGVSYSADILATPGLVHYYRLGEAVGATQAVDSKGTQNSTAVGTGVTFGATSLITTSSGNTAASFNGTANAHIDLPNPAITSGSWAIEAWVNLAGAGSAGTAVDYGTIYGSSSSARLLISSTSTHKILAQFGGVNVFSTDTYAVGTKNHVVLEYDSTANALNLYVNGVLEGTATPTSTPTLNAVAWIGAFTSNFDAYMFNGIIDELAIYNAALGLATVQDHYAKGTS